MFPPRTSTIANPPGDVTTQHLDAGIIESVYRGYCSVALVRAVLDLAPEVLHDLPGARLLLDLSQVTGSDPRSVVPGGAIMKLCRERGAKCFAVVIPGGVLRMAVAAAAFGAGMPIETFAARADALAYLRGLPPG